MAPRVVLITGCSSGIGMVTAVKLAQDGDKSYLVYATMRNLAKRADLEEAAGSVLNDKLFVRELDVTKEDQIVKVVKELFDRHGRVDVLINNAAYGGLGVFEDLSMDYMKNMFETNFFGTARMTQEVIPIMKRQRSGRIINVSSVAGIAGVPFNEIYCAVKYAIQGLTECLYPQLRHFGVWISGIQPGPVATKFIDNMSANQPSLDKKMGATADPETMQMMTAFMGQMGKQMTGFMQQSEDIADVILRCLKAEKPDLHYPTRDLTQKRMEEKFVDPTGVAPTEMWFQMLTAPSTS